MINRLLPLGFGVLALLGGAAAAQGFQWTPDQFPPGDQSYTLEIRLGEGADLQLSTIEIDVTDTGGAFDVASTITFEQTGLSQADLSGAAFGGSTLGMFSLGPMLLYGPTFMLLPMLLGQEEIRVRQEPIRVLGMGSVLMDREEEVAGYTCVVITFVTDDDPDNPVVFAVADGLAFPCFTRYGAAGDRVEMRLVDVQP